MKKFQDNLNHQKIKSHLLQWLQNQLKKKSCRWITSASERLQSAETEDWEIFSTISAVPRQTGKKLLNLTDTEKQDANKLRPGWEPATWQSDQAGRTLLVLSFANRKKNEFLDKLEKLFVSSDMNEAMALYQSLPVLPYPEELKPRAAEGIRSNMTSVFNAVAHRNPYPAEYLDDGAWNQLVLKALFVESPLYLIKGLDERANKELAEMLVEYAHERWSAGRPVSPELWRSVGPFTDNDMSDDIKKVLNHPDELQKQAGILALSASGFREADKLLEEHKDILQEIKRNDITWDDIGKKYHND